MSDNVQFVTPCCDVEVILQYDGLAPIRWAGVGCPECELTYTIVYQETEEVGGTFPEIDRLITPPPLGS